jgi:threonine/homoserine/homoserine lactone efflux protein
MELTAWLSLVSICTMGAMTPGPSLAVVLKHTVGGGRTNGLVSAVAHGLGVALYALITVLGLAIVINESPLLFNAIRYTGVVFILWLAYKAFTSQSDLAKLGDSTVKVTLGQSFSEGFMIAFVNPKLAIFFMALFSQFIQAGATFELNAVMVTTVGAIDFLWYSLIAVVLSQSGMLKVLRNNVRIVERLTGVALLTVAARAVM